ncbi:MAG: DMT family transporter [Pseudomonadales bacterium]|nr:DMT family transporter [Pseudomonadales bacterium]
MKGAANHLQAKTADHGSINGYWYGLAAVAIWSGFILVSRYGGVGPLMANDVIAIRYVTCSLVLLPIWWFRHRINLLNVKLIVACLIGGLAYALCAFRGFERAPASHAAVLMPGTLPMITIILASIINREKHRANKWLGVAVMSLGICGLIWSELASTQAINPGHGLFVSAAFCWALLSVLVHRWHLSPWEVTIGLAFITSIVYLPAYLLFLPKNIANASWMDIGLQALYQGVLATVVQMVLYMNAVRTIGPSSMGSLMAIVPVLAGVLAILLFDEALTEPLMLALILVSLGSWFAHGQIFNRKRTTECLTST